MQCVLGANDGLVKWEVRTLGLYQARGEETREACGKRYSKADGTLGTHVSM